MQFPHLKSFALYLQLEKGLGTNTQKAYVSDVYNFLSQMPVVCGTSAISNITYNHLAQYVSHVAALEIAPASQARIVASLRSFFKFLVAEGDIPASPAQLLAPPKLKRSIPPSLSVADVDAICAAINHSSPFGHRDRAIIEVLYGGGLRVSELCTLRLSGINFRAGYMLVTGKGNKQRLVPIGTAMHKHLQLYLTATRNSLPVHPQAIDAVFLNYQGKPLSRISVFKIIKQLASSAQIANTISPHTFRHTFATHLVEGGADLFAVKELLGHSSITTTEMYTHAGNAYLHQVVNTCHPRK